MKRFNRWANYMFQPTVSDAHRALYPLKALQIQRVPGKTYCQFQNMTMGEFMAARPAHVLPRQWEILRRTIEHGAGVNNSALAELWVISSFAHNGPKVFAPSAEDFLSLSRMEIKLPISSFAQPFETFVLAVPEEAFPNRISADHGFPAAIIGRHDRKNGALVTLAAGIEPTELGPAEQDGRKALSLVGAMMVSTFCYHPDESRLIEDYLDRANTEVDIPNRQSWPLDKSEGQYFDSVTRAYFNACLMLTRYGCREIGPTNREYFDKLTASLKKKNLPEKVRLVNASALANIPIVYTVKQSITLRETRAHLGDPGEPTGRHVNPHWRRGHWARQRHGPGNTLVKDVLRPEVFVNRHRFGGNLGDTSTEYHK